MKNQAESMPNPNLQPERQVQGDSEVERLLKKFEQEDKEAEMAEALAGLEKAVDDVREKQLLDKEFEQGFEGIMDKPAIEADAHVEQAFQRMTAPHEVPKAAEAEKAKFNNKHNFMEAAAAQLKGALAEFRQSRTLDVVLDTYKPDMAEAELLDKPLYAALEAAGVPSAHDLDKLAGDLISQNNPAYEAMDPASQAEARKMIMPMVEGTVQSFRDIWRQGIVKSIQMKLGMLEDNQEMLEQAREALSDPKAIKEHDDSIAKNRRMMENARSLLSSFSE